MSRGKLLCIGLVMVILAILGIIYLISKGL